MTKIGPLIVMKAADHPVFLKAEKLARCLSFNDIEEILAGHKHLHANPVRKQKYPIPEREVRAMVDEEGGGE